MVSIINIKPTPEEYSRWKASFKHSIETRGVLIGQANTFIRNFVEEACTADYDAELLDWLEKATHAFIAEQNASIEEMQATIDELEKAGY